MMYDKMKDSSFCEDERLSVNAEVVEFWLGERWMTLDGAEIKTQFGQCTPMDVNNGRRAGD